MYASMLLYLLFIGFAELQSHYSVLVRSMPDDYMNTVSQLERHLTGDHIGSILECADVFTANQRILDCLIEQLDKKEDVFDLCEKLSNITDTPSLNAAIEDLKKGINLCPSVCLFDCLLAFSMYVYVCTYVTLSKGDTVSRETIHSLATLSIKNMTESPILYLAQLFIIQNQIRLRSKVNITANQ